MAYSNPPPYYPNSTTIATFSPFYSSTISPTYSTPTTIPNSSPHPNTISTPTQYSSFPTFPSYPYHTHIPPSFTHSSHSSTTNSYSTTSPPPNQSTYQIFPSYPYHNQHASYYSTITNNTTSPPANPYSTSSTPNTENCNYYQQQIHHQLQPVTTFQNPETSQNLLSKLSEIDEKYNKTCSEIDEEYKQKEEATRLALKEKLQQLSDKYIALKQSRQERFLKKKSEKIEEKEPTKDENSEATIQESSLKEDEEEFVGENKDTIQSVNREETERHLIEEPPLLMPLESVDFTPKNGVAVIALQETVKTPLHITTLPAPPLPEKPPDPPPHPIIAPFPPPTPPQVLKQLLVFDPPSLPCPPKPPYRKFPLEKVSAPPLPFPPPEPPDKAPPLTPRSPLRPPDFQFQPKTVFSPPQTPPPDTILCTYPSLLPPPKPPDPKLPPEILVLVLGLSTINSRSLSTRLEVGLGSGTINSLGDKIHPSLLCHLSPTKQIPSTETCHVSHYACNYKCNKTPNTHNRTIILMCQLLSNFKNSKLASNVPTTNPFAASYVHSTKFSFTGLHNLGLRVTGQIFTLDNFCLATNSTMLQVSFQCNLIDPPHTRPPCKPPDLYPNLEDKVQVNPAAMIED